MSAFHRIDDIRAMPAQRFINLALRLFAYKGIVRALVEAEQWENSGHGQHAPAASAPSRDRTVASDAATLESEFAGLVETRKG